MAQRIKATLGTAAITGGNQVAFTIPSRAFRNQSRVHLMAEGLAGAEVITLWALAGAEWVELTVDRGTGTGAGAQAILDAGNPLMEISAPGTYGVTKSATAGAVNIILEDGI